MMVLYGGGGSEGAITSRGLFDLRERKLGDIEVTTIPRDEARLEVDRPTSVWLISRGIFGKSR